MKPIVSGSPRTRRPAALPRRWSWPRRAPCLLASRWLLALAIRLSLLWQPGGLGRAGGSASLVADSRAHVTAAQTDPMPMQRSLRLPVRTGPDALGSVAIALVRHRWSRAGSGRLLRRQSTTPGFGSSQSERARPAPGRARSHPACCDHAHGRGGTIALGLRVRRCHRESNSAADPAGLVLHDYRSAGANQLSAAPGRTAAGVANQQPDALQKQQRGVRRQPHAVRLAHHPGYAAVRRARQDS